MAADSVIDTLVIGGGQAGLSASWHLKQVGREHLVLDRGRIADPWRNRWDNFFLVTPNHLCRLPGFPYDGDDPQGFMSRAQIVDYLERYAASFDPPYQTEVEVTNVRASAGPGRFEATTTTGTIYATNLIVAAGTHQHPNIPLWHDDLPDGVTTVHSRFYRNAAELPEGAVFVVGSGQSGCQIAEDLRREGRRVHLAVGHAGRIPRRYRGRDILDWDILTGYMAVPVDQHPEGTAVRFMPHPHVSGRDGGYTVDLRQMALDGIQLHSKVTGVADGSLQFAGGLAEALDKIDELYQGEVEAIDKYIEKHGLDCSNDRPPIVDWQPGPEKISLDLAEAGVSTVIYGTGFHYNFKWIDLPIFDERGYPRYDRGVTEIPGLYFCGLHWAQTQGSALFYGVGKDAEYIVNHLVRQ